VTTNDSRSSIESKTERRVSVFTARCYAKRGTDTAKLSVRPSVSVCDVELSRSYIGPIGVL